MAGKTAQLTEAASGQGFAPPPLNAAVCLDRYLDLVEGILR